MERLTKRYKPGKYNLEQMVTQAEAVNLLGKYEDTGLSPHQIDELKTMQKLKYERIKEKYGLGEPYEKKEED